MAKQRGDSLLGSLWTIGQFLPLPFRLLLILAIVVISGYLQWQRGEFPPAPHAPPSETVEAARADTLAASSRLGSSGTTSLNKPSGDDPAVIASVTLRNPDGEVIYTGPVDLRPTLERIGRGERLSRFAHDGSVFNNRERRLPSEPTGYYHEWVHPTPNERGPGPQRIVTGESGAAWYTHDHYVSFRKIRP